MSATKINRANLFKLMAVGLQARTYPPDTETPIETLKAAIEWQVEQARKLCSAQVLSLESVRSVKRAVPLVPLLPLLPMRTRNGASGVALVD